MGQASSVQNPSAYCAMSSNSQNASAPEVAHTSAQEAIIEPSPSAARDSVIGTLELYENILSFLPAADLMRTRRVNTITNEVITNVSPALQVQARLRQPRHPIPRVRWRVAWTRMRRDHYVLAEAHERVQLSDPNNRIFDVLTASEAIFSWGRSAVPAISLRVHQSVITPPFRPCIISAILRDLHDGQTSSCNAMQLFDPPCSAAVIYMRVQIGPISLLVKRSVAAANGLTLQHIIDRAFGLYDRAAFRSHEVIVEDLDSRQGPGQMLAHQHFGEAYVFGRRPLSEYILALEKKHDTDVMIWSLRLDVPGCVLATDADRVRVAKQRG